MKTHYSILLISVLLLAGGCTARETTQEDNRTLPDSLYIQQGNIIVKATFDTLRNSLLRAMADHGTEGAITFCHEHSASLSATYIDSVSVRRTSLKYRNPKNQPDSLELEILSALAMEQPSTVKLIHQPQWGEIHFFKPIVVQAMCLNCHGTPHENINEKTFSRIQQLYPDDRATDYKEGDLRGAWHLVFKTIKK